MIICIKIILDIYVSSTYTVSTRDVFGDGEADYCHERSTISKWFYVRWAWWPVYVRSTVKLYYFKFVRTKDLKNRIHFVLEKSLRSLCTRSISHVTVLKTPDSFNDALFSSKFPLVNSAMSLTDVLAWKDWISACSVFNVTNAFPVLRAPKMRHPSPTGSLCSHV